MYIQSSDEASVDEYNANLAGAPGYGAGSSVALSLDTQQSMEAD